MGVMKYNENASVEKLWFDLTVGMIRKYGLLKTAGTLAGILARLTKYDINLKRELKRRIEEV
jgi:hypothetical protein